jgi:hypothetical protein
MRLLPVSALVFGCLLPGTISSTVPPTYMHIYTHDREREKQHQTATNTGPIARTNNTPK